MGCRFARPAVSADGLGPPRRGFVRPGMWERPGRPGCVGRLAGALYGPRNGVVRGTAPVQNTAQA